MKICKKIMPMIFRFFLLTGRFAPSLFFVFFLGNLNAEAAEPLRIVYGFDREFPPFSYEEAGGEAVGFEIDLVKAIFNRPDVVLSMRPLNWENVMLELSSGTIGLTSGMVETDQRKKLYLFAKQPHFLLQIRFFTKVYHRVASAALLRGQMVAVERGSYQHRLLEEYGGINIKTYPGRIDGLKALYRDEVAAYCGAVPNTYYYINKLNYGAITTVDTPVGITELRFAVNRGRGDIVQMLNEGLTRLQESGEYNRLYKKWFVRDLTDQEITLLKQAAKQALIPAYTPYRLPAQGAAILTVTGKIYTGCTVENADPNVNICALAGALSQAINDGQFEFSAAAIVGANGEFQSPSHAELQLLYEFGRGILIIEENDHKPTVSLVGAKLMNPVVVPSKTIAID